MVDKMLKNREIKLSDTTEDKEDSTIKVYSDSVENSASEIEEDSLEKERSFQQVKIKVPISKILTEYSTSTQATVEEIDKFQKDLQKSLDEGKRKITYHKSEVV